MLCNIDLLYGSWLQIITSEVEKSFGIFELYIDCLATAICDCFKKNIVSVRHLAFYQSSCYCIYNKLIGSGMILRGNHCLYMNRTVFPSGNFVTRLQGKGVTLVQIPWQGYRSHLNQTLQASYNKRCTKLFYL